MVNDIDIYTSSNRNSEYLDELSIHFYLLYISDKCTTNGGDRLGY